MKSQSRIFYRLTSLVLVVLLVHSTTWAQTQPQSPSQPLTKMQQVLHKAQEKDKAVKVILNKKIDNQKKFSGKVSEISDTGFVVTDQKTGKIQQLAYEDVREVHQKGWPKAATIAIVVIAGVVIAAAVVLYSIAWK